jgi:hypothetical protein
MFVVVENTPGYLPEDDFPAEFVDFSAAVEYASRLARDIADSLYGYADEREYAVSITREHRALWRIVSDMPHDLGRVVEIIEDEGEAV